MTVLHDKPMCIKKCIHWGRSQEDCISDTDGVCEATHGWCDTRFECVAPTQRQTQPEVDQMRALRAARDWRDRMVERALGQAPYSALPFYDDVAYAQGFLDGLAAEREDA